MQSNIIKFFTIALFLGTLAFIKADKVSADCIVCDGGSYRGGGCDGWSACTGYNMGCQSPNGPRCGDCWKCDANGNYVPSGDRSCSQYSTPSCTRGANYSRCWPRYCYCSTQYQYLWYDELGTYPNYLCHNPSLTLNTSSIQQNQQVAVTWITNNKNASNWIGLYSVGSPDSSYVSWFYGNSCTTSSNGQARPYGTCNVTISSAGTYEFRYFYAGGWTKIATSSQVIVANPTPTPTPTPTPLPAPQPTVIPPGGLPPDQCVSGNLMSISWVNNVNPVTWVDIAVNDPNFNTYYHKNVTNISLPNQSAQTYAPAGFTYFNSTQPMQFCPSQSYYVRLYNGVSTNGGHSMSSVVIPPIPTYTPTPTPTPRPWTKTSGGDIHVNQ